MHRGAVAQQEERVRPKHTVGGSIPSGAATTCLPVFSLATFHCPRKSRRGGEVRMFGKHTVIAAFCVVLAALGVAGDASAQRKVETPSAVVCSELQNPDQPLSAGQLQTAHLCQEIAKLREEVRAFEATNRAASSDWGFLIPWTGIIAAAVSALVAIVVPATGMWLQGRFEKSQGRKFDQERSLQDEAHALQMTLQRAAHNFELMKGLGETNNKSVQLASASSLLRRLEELRRSGRAGVERTGEYRTIADIVISVLRDPNIDVSVSKYVADEMIGVFDLRRGDTGASAATPAAMKDYNMQGTRLSQAFWANVVADDVDFFGADLSGASLRGASMVRAVLYEADLRKAVLIDACLKEANFYAADLRGARLDGADLTDATNLDKAVVDATTRWNDKTVWPAGFIPKVDPA